MSTEKVPQSIGEGADCQGSSPPTPTSSLPKKSSKSRRKISMPWFRQSSFGMSLARLRLPKQHTIATSEEVAGSSAVSGSGRDHLGHEEASLEANKKYVRLSFFCYKCTLTTLESVRFLVDDAET
jgi:hypothetical protein